ncbi:MAG: hypothetical protein EXS19_05425 [Pedosphaera sp.]|nr:hypothetical protein [Pedosphaera sp.]
MALGVATQTLWSGITAEQVVAISYGDVKRIEIHEYEMRLQYESGNTLEVELRDKEFSKAIIESVGDYVKLTIVKKSRKPSVALIVVIVLISIFGLIAIGSSIITFLK